MIIDFKLFENNNDKKFWRVRVNGYFTTSLYKIGMPIYRIKTYIYIMKGNARYIYVGCENDEWNYKIYHNTLGKNRYEEIGYEYMGDVEITEDDIKKYEYDKEIYNLQRGNTVKKYNL